nr:MAG TPA: hypothetical protein [Caudoviricetes sp.]
MSFCYLCDSYAALSYCQSITHTLFTQPLPLLSRLPFASGVAVHLKFPVRQRTNQVEPCPILAIGCRSLAVSRV